MRVLAWLALLGSGAAGLGFQALLLAASGIALGHASGVALGLAAFLAAWALGAGTSVRLGPPTAAGLGLAGLAQAALGVGGTVLVLGLGAAAASLPVATALALGAVGCVAFVQGLLFAWLASLEDRAGRGVRRDAAVVFGANLLGAALGAHFLAGELVGFAGRIPAAVGAAALGLFAAALGAWLAARVPAAALRPAEEASQDAGITAAQAAWIVGLGSAWLAANEWIGLRLCALWLGGMEPALRAGLTAALAGLSLGAWVLPRLLPAGRRGVLALLGGAAVFTAWPWALARLPADFARSTEAAGALATLGSAALLVAPPLVFLGALVPVVQRAVRGERERELGRLLVHEAWGAGLAVPLVHLVLVPAAGLAGALVFGLACCAACALLFARVSTRTALPVLAVAGASAALLVSGGKLSLAAPPYRDPALRVLRLDEDRDFAVAVVDDGLRGERTLLTDGFRAAGTGVEYRYMRVLGHLPLLLHPAPRAVAVLALGTGTTLGAVALHPEVERIDVLEISRAVVDAAPWFAVQNHGVLEREPGRVHVLLGDGRRTLADHPDTYDVITMEPLLPDSPFGVYLYTREFYLQARRALRPGGIVCQWVPPHALEPETFHGVLATFATAFEWSGVWLAGTQVVLIGAGAEPALAAERFPREGALHAALAGLGLPTAAGVAARYVGPAPRQDSGVPRLLTDEHPWVIYRPRRSGSVLLADLPANLGNLRRTRAALPKSWTEVVGADGTELRGGIAELHRARELHASEEARLRGVGRPDPTGQRVALAEALERAHRWAPGDPEVAELEAEIEFLASVRAGVAELTGGDASTAERALVRAAELRPDRADVAAYLAVARERTGDPASRTALERAAELCPRIAETPAGERLRTLGLSAGSWAFLTARAAGAP